MTSRSMSADHRIKFGPMVCQKELAWTRSRGTYLLPTIGELTVKGLLLTITASALNVFSCRGRHV
jgi:hypothetical protein